MKKNKSLRLSLFTVIALLLLASCTTNNDTPVIEVTYDSTLSEDPFDGRLLVLISKDNSKEPRFQINDTNDSGIVIGKNVSQWESGQIEIFNSSTEAYPIENLADLETGTYYMQALLHKYETFNLANGHQVKLPMDQGEGQHWNTSPKNIYSKPLKINYQKGTPIKLNITEEIPPIDPVQDTEYIKHIKIKSELLSEFWGRPMYLQANVLVPEGFDKAAEARYPLMVFHGHFPKTIGGFRTTPPTAAKEDSIFNPRFGITGYKYIQENSMVCREMEYSSLKLNILKTLNQRTYPSELFKELKRLFPDFMDFIVNKKIPNHKEISHMGFRAESSIFIQEYMALPKEMFALPIHDCLLVKEKDVDFVKNRLIKRTKSVYKGILPDSLELKGLFKSKRVSLLDEQTNDHQINKYYEEKMGDIDFWG